MHCAYDFLIQTFMFRPVGCRQLTFTGSTASASQVTIVWNYTDTTIIILVLLPLEPLSLIRNIVLG